MEDFHSAMNGARAELLNLLQAVVDPSRWEYVRSRILKILGRNGLESKLIDIFQKHGATSGTGETNGAVFPTNQQQ